jgi:hypothetical protein
MLSAYYPQQNSVGNLFMAVAICRLRIIQDLLSVSLHCSLYGLCEDLTRASSSSIRREKVTVTDLSTLTHSLKPIPVFRPARLPKIV